MAAAHAAKPAMNNSKGVYLKDNRTSAIIQQKRKENLQEQHPTTFVLQKKNRTGLPDTLKAGIENLSGYSMDDVKVHYNSPEPAQLNAHAFAQGNQIHVAPGQEKHLPHEAWHVVQQKQGRVKATKQLKSQVNINDDAGLEKEADVMGKKAESIRNPSVHKFALSQKYNSTPFANNQLKKRNYQSKKYHPSIAVLPTDKFIYQLHDNRLVADPRANDSRKQIQYYAGWILDGIDLFTKGKLYDGIALVLSIMGESSLLSKAEEALRFLQHHPELVEALGTAIQAFLGSTYGLPIWLVQLILTVLSRGASADWIGDMLFSVLMASPEGGVVKLLYDGLKRRLGRSLINRGLTFAYSIGGSLISGISRILHGYSITPGTSGRNGESMSAPTAAFGGIYSIISNWLPLERLHIIPNRRGGYIHDQNAVYGSAATNSMMIPNEARGSSAVAIRSPTGFLEAMGMNLGAFLGRGMRPREGFIEHWFASRGLA